jgi:hypothetical protein
MYIDDDVSAEFDACSEDVSERMKPIRERIAASRAVLSAEEFHTLIAYTASSLIADGVIQQRQENRDKALANIVGGMHRITMELLATFPVNPAKQALH